MSMQNERIAFLGFGDLGQRCARLLSNREIYAVCRSEKLFPEGVNWWQGAVDSADVLSRMKDTPIDIAVLTLTPAAFSEEAYYQAYVEPIMNLLAFWRSHQSPKFVVMASSTGVYHQQDGEWVDEFSDTAPKSFSGKNLLKAESLLLNQSLFAASVVRFGGIYGPGREYLVRDVKAGNGGNAAFTNRIHVEDCAAVIHFLIERWERGEAIEPVYLACDSDPAPGNQVRAWLAESLGINPGSLQASSSARGGNKRCSNLKLLEAGYEFKYPSYKDGYSAMLSAPTSAL